MIQLKTQCVSYRPSQSSENVHMRCRRALLLLCTCLQRRTLRGDEKSFSNKNPNLTFEVAHELLLHFQNALSEMMRS